MPMAPPMTLTTARYPNRSAAPIPSCSGTGPGDATRYGAASSRPWR